MCTKLGGTHVKKAATSRSGVVLDQFSFPVGKAAVDAEMPRGKRTQPAKVYANPIKVYDELALRELKVMFN